MWHLILCDVWGWDGGTMIVIITVYYPCPTPIRVASLARVLRFVWHGLFWL